MTAMQPANKGEDPLEPRCWKCGYSLRGLPGGTYCPECGYQHGRSAPTGGTPGLIGAARSGQLCRTYLATFWGALGGKVTANGYPKTNPGSLTLAPGGFVALTCLWMLFFKTMYLSLASPSIRGIRPSSWFPPPAVWLRLPYVALFEDFPFLCPVSWPGFHAGGSRVPGVDSVIAFVASCVFLILSGWAAGLALCPSTLRRRYARATLRTAAYGMAWLSMGQLWFAMLSAAVALSVAPMTYGQMQSLAGYLLPTNIFLSLLILILPQVLFLRAIGQPLGWSMLVMAAALLFLGLAGSDCQFVYYEATSPLFGRFR